MALSGEKASIFNFGIANMLPNEEENAKETAKPEEKPVKKEKEQAKKPENTQKPTKSATHEAKKSSEGEKPKTKKEPEKVIEHTTSIKNIPSKKGHGVAKSVYFDDDNYAYIDRVSKANDVKFSVILNLLVKQFREEHEGK